ncbi:MAG: hypothetical protein K8I60_03660, partial [Anaerolineae bacterium]|nr:hypothetical protein [Anaerolineae bacterium]
MENTVMPSEAPRNAAIGRLLLGLVVGVILLIPLVAVLANVQLGPALRTYDLSLTDGNILREPRPVENGNYERLAQDERLTAAVNYTLRLVGGRIVAVTLFPVLIGLLVGVQGMVGRMVNRVLLGLLTVTAAPVIMITLWRMYWMPIWGNQPSPVYPPPDNMLLTRPEGAQNALLRLDNTITLAIAMIALVVIYAAVVRGWRKGRLSAALQAGVGAWLISLLLAGFSGLQVFVLPMLVTDGGPMNSTNTVMLDMYTTGFRFFRLGLGAAEAVYLMGAALVIGFLVWLVTVAFRLRLSFTPPAQIHRRASLLSIITIPALLIVAYPL